MEKKQKRAFWTKRNIAIITTVLIVLAVGIGAMVWWMMSQRITSSEPSPDIDAAKAAAEVKQTEADGKLRDTAAEELKNNQAAKADEIYQEAIDAETTVERKTRLYLDLSGVYYAAKQYDEAFEAAKKAENLNPDKFLVADWLSRLYEDQKNYTQAAAYYKLAGEWADSAQNKTALDKAYYDGKAAEMTKLANGGKN